MKNVLIRVNNYIGELLGVKLKKTKKAPLQIVKANHPLEALYSKNTLPFLMNLPLSKGRVWRWYPINMNSKCPFIVAAKKFRKTKMEKDIIETLMNYTKSIQEHDANENLGLYGKYKTFPDGLHRKATTFPWGKKTIKESYRSWKKSSLKENLEFGYNKVEDFGCNTNSVRKIEIEANRLKNVLISIKNNGYLFFPNDCIGATILCDGREWRWTVYGGQHRASVLGALGFNDAPILVKQIVRREDVDLWPNVKSGVYTKEAALHLFDRKFNAVPPSIYDRWVNSI